MQVLTCAFDWPPRCPRSIYRCGIRIGWVRLDGAHFVAPHLDVRADLVADLTRVGEALFMHPAERGGIGKTPVQPPSHTGEDGAALGATFVADGDHVGESGSCRTGSEHVEYRLSLLLRNINPDLAHRFHCQRIELSWFEPGAVRFKMIAANFIKKRFGHLAAGAVMNANKKDFLFHRVGRFIPASLGEQGVAHGAWSLGGQANVAVMFFAGHLSPEPRGWLEFTARYAVGKFHFRHY